MKFAVSAISLVVKHSLTQQLRQANRFRGIFARRDISYSAWHSRTSSTDDSSEQKSRLPSNWGSKKQHRKVKLNFAIDMADSKTEEILAPLRALVKEQVCYGNVKLFNWEWF